MSSSAATDARPVRYHPAVIILHWLIAIMIVAPLVFGARHLANMANNDPAKIGGLKIHMTVGLLIGALMLMRFAVRVTTRAPAPASTGSAFLDWLAWASHRLLYLAVLAQVTVGIWLASQAGLFAGVFGGDGNLPSDFWVFPARTIHYILSRLIMALIGVHVLGALYHTVVRRDRLLQRIFFSLSQGR